jgi:3-phosphoshikimate 1-carboxyvinyltransferase
MQTNISVPDKIIIHPSKISGSVVAAASKSSMQRACAAALVRCGVSVIHNPGVSNDDMASLNVIKTLGAKTEYLADGSLKINSADIQLPDTLNINFGESGLGIRMFTPIAALTKSLVNIEGEGSLISRPMDFFDEILPQLHVQISSNNGKLPLKIKGPLVPKNIEIDGSLSSQFLTGLLLAFAASLPTEGEILGKNDKIIIKVNNLKSKPYIDLTLKVMKDFGLPVPENKNYEEFIFQKSKIENQKSEINYAVEGDWSGGAFLLAAGAIAGSITVLGLDVHSTQADKKILEALKDCGCQLFFDNNKILVSPPKKGRGVAFHFDANDCPDLFPPLVALAAYCDGVTEIEGVERLTHKESNRALTLQEEFAKLGIEIVLENNLMKIKGGTPVKSAVTQSRHDHRIAMACAVAALGAEGAVKIEDAAAIKKSYPNFYQHLLQLGVNLS